MSLRRYAEAQDTTEEQDQAWGKEEVQQAALMDLKYAATGNQQFRDEAVRLRRVKVDLDDFVPDINLASLHEKHF